MPNDFQPAKSGDGMAANRRKRRQISKKGRQEAKRAEHMPSRSRMPIHLNTVPLWSKVLISGIFFAYCGGMELLDALSSHFQGDSLRLLLFIPIVIVAVTAYCSWPWWAGKNKTPSEARKVRDFNDSPVEMVHGKWRIKRKGPVVALPARKTAGQLKARQPSRKYGTDIQQAPMSSPFEMVPSSFAHHPTDQLQ